MPRARSTRRPLFRRRGKFQKGYRRLRQRKALARAGGKHGGMFVVRKYKQIITQNLSGYAGAYEVGPPGIVQNCLYLGTITASPLGAFTNLYDVPFAMQFRLDDVVGLTDFTNLFDKYKITSAMVKIQTTLNVAQQNEVPIPFIDYVVDRDDVVPPTGTEMREKMGVKTKYFNASKPVITLGVKPTPVVEASASPFNGGIVPKGAPYINMANNDVPHFGIKGIIRNLYIPPTQGSAGFTWDVSLGLALKDVQ